MANYEDILQQYREYYDIDTLATPNDRANLDILIRNKMLIDKIQARVQLLVEDEKEEILDSVSDLKKLQDSLRDLVDQSLAIERALGIDRKSRKKENQENAADYIQMIKSAAKEWLEKNLITVYCPRCKVLAGRVFPAHEHTEIDVKFQCSQCGKWATIKRAERDIFFDLKERNKEWRKRYPIEVELPESTLDSYEDDTILKDEEE